MITVTLSEPFKATYPGAAIGILAMRHVANPAHHAALDARKRELEAQLRARFSGADRAALKALPTLQAYTAYYKRFKKSYHVQLQLESVVFKDKPIASVSALVETMFMAELKNWLLTAVHDLSLVQMPVMVSVADGSERYTCLDGREETLKPGDMAIADAQGILSSIVYGPDQRTQVTADTTQVLYTVYAPPGIEEQAVTAHLQDIQATVLLVAPQAETELLHVYGAG